MAQEEKKTTYTVGEDEITLTRAIVRNYLTRGNAAVTALAARGLFHLTGIEEFDLLFGCERFDPFVTFGAAALFASRHVFADDSHRTAIGPTAGVGAFYHLTDSWSLRFDATAAMAVDTPCGMCYGLSLGLQWCFGE